MKDRRIFLRIKLASLVAESRIIRQAEIRAAKRAQYDLCNELSLHRRGVVRRVARETGLALGFIRGRTYEQMEPKVLTAPDWPKVVGMLKKYGPPGMPLPECCVLKVA